MIIKEALSDYRLLKYDGEPFKVQIICSAGL